MDGLLITYCYRDTVTSETVQEVGVNLDTASKSSLDGKRSKIVDAMISSASNHPQALALLAQVVLANGEEARARSLALRARTLAPEDPEIALVTAEVLSDGIPTWHYSLVRDEARNAAFDASLRRAVRPGMRVLDIGSGTGLLAMMAARAGAARSKLRNESRDRRSGAQNLAENGYGDRVRIIPKNSADLDPVADLGGPVDLLVSEIIGNDMVCEGTLPTIEKAANHFLKPGRQIIPASGAIRVALAHHPQRNKRRMGTVDGFDLSAFNELAPKIFPLKWYEHSVTLLSEPADLFTFDFASGGPFREGRSSVSVAARQGTASGIVQWIYLKMDEFGEYENHPVDVVSSNWAVLFYPFSEDLRCDAGDRIKISGSHDRQHLRVWMESKDAKAC